MIRWRRVASSRFVRLALVAAFILPAGAGTLRAVSPVRWSQQSLADFEKGKPEGVAVTGRGELVLARSFREIQIPALQENAQPFLWSGTVDSKGNLYVGSGNEGRVFRIPRSGPGSLFYSSGDLAVQALAVDSRDNLYVGTSPDGKVYRVGPDGKSEVWFDPDERYIWALAVDRSGNLYVGTGEHGIIYKVTDRGKGTPFFDSEESHIVVLVVDPQGSLFAGSSGKGLLYRVSPDGKGTVLLDTSFKEVNAVALDPDGTIYASAILSESPRSRSAPPRRSLTGEEAGPERVVVTTPSPGPILAQVAGEETGGEKDEETAAGGERGRARSQVYRIDPDGVGTAVWNSESETVFSLAAAGRKEVYLGTGDAGKVRRLESDGISSLVAKVDSSQVTSLQVAPDGGLYIAGSNAGKIYRLEPEVGDSGTYLSPPRDATTLARWGQIDWIGSVPAGTKVELFTRTGNSAVPDSTWSGWSPAYVAQAGTGVTSPAARFIQWKARLTRQAKGATPSLEAVRVTYLPANLPPKVSKLRINPPGVVILKPPLLPEAEGPDTAFAARPDLPEGVELPSPFPAVPGKKVFQRGMRSVTWEASDPNGDTLRYDLHYRGDGEREWKPLGRGLKDEYFAWDSNLLPEGRYWIRVIASDVPSNPPGSEKSAAEISAPFVVDNTPPRIEPTLRKDARGSAVEVRVTDATSPIRSLEYSVDAAPWILVMPVDGIADSASEEYRFTLDRLPAGEHTVLLKASDSEGNVGTGQALVSGG